MSFVYRVDRAVLDEIKALRAEARRLGTDEECFCASNLSMTLSEFRVFVETGEAPTGWRR
jgi:hypothetical protein